MPGEQLLLINPRRRRRHKNTRRAHKRRRVRNPRRHHAHRRRRHNPIMRYRRRRHRNPISLGGIKSALVPAAMGAAGAIAFDALWSYVSPYVPASLTGSTYTNAAVKIAGALGMGMLARKFLGSEKGNAVMAGALTVQVYALMSNALAGTVPGVTAQMGAYIRPMSGLGSPNPAPYLNGVGRVGRVGRVGAYMRPMSGLSGLPFGGLGNMGAMTTGGDMFDMGS